MSKKIILIDDDPVGTTLIESRLVKEGFQVRVANTGKVGLNMIHMDMPDVIVLDVEMPDINGYDVVLELKSSETTRNLRIIVLTSHEENRPIFARKGVKDYLVKPVNPDLLIKCINEDESESS